MGKFNVNLAAAGIAYTFQPAAHIHARVTKMTLLSLSMARL